MGTKRKVEAFIILSFVAFVGTKGYLWSHDTTLSEEKDRIVKNMSDYVSEKTNEAVNSVKDSVRGGYDGALTGVGIKIDKNRKTKETPSSDNNAKSADNSATNKVAEGKEEKPDNKNSDKGLTARYKVAFKYDHTGAPKNFSKDEILAMLTYSSGVWERSCGVKFEFVGETRSDYVSAQNSGTSGEKFGIVRWSELGADALGQAHLGSENGPVGDFIMDLNRDLFANKRQAEYLQSTITHELGHVVGLEHSRLPESVMFFQQRSNISKLNEGDTAKCSAVVSGWEKNPRNNKFKA